MNNPYQLYQARIEQRIDESPSVFTLRLGFTDPLVQAEYHFAPGQFNMVYLFGVGEVPISIVSDPAEDNLLDHTIRAVGRVTNGLSRLQTGEMVGIRGPYGRGWPLSSMAGQDVLVITGGLGCAPSVSVINYIMKRRSDFGRLTIMQGVKHYNDLLWRERYAEWSQHPDTEVLLAADVGGPLWPWHTGPVTNLFDSIEIDPGRTMVIMCGPQGMMQAAMSHLLARQVAEDRVWLSMERNMQCAVGHCGHCQYGARFVCKDGPVFNYSEIKPLLTQRGF